MAQVQSPRQKELTVEEAGDENVEKAHAGNAATARGHVCPARSRGIIRTTVRGCQTAYRITHGGATWSCLESRRVDMTHITFHKNRSRKVIIEADLNLTAKWGTLIAKDFFDRGYATVGLRVVVRTRIGENDADRVSSSHVGRHSRRV